MQKTKEILFGVGLAFLWFLIFMLINNLVLIPRLLGNFSDALYMGVAAIILIAILIKKKWIIASAFGVFAVLLSVTGILVIVGMLGCAIGQCPIY
jgi:hypothetical protein